MELSEIIADELSLILYGDPLKGFPELIHPFDKEHHFPIRVYGFKRAGRCHTLPKPKTFLLPGEGLPLSEHGECEWKSPKRKWILHPKMRTATLEIAAGELETILIQESTARAARIVSVIVHANATTTPNPIRCSKSAEDRIEWNAGDGYCSVSFDAGISPFAPQGATDPDSYVMLRKGETRQTHSVYSDATLGNHSFDIYAHATQGNGIVMIDP